MKEFEERLKNLEYYFSLLVPMVNWKEYPFNHLVITYSLTQVEVQKLFSICKELEQVYIEEKKEGFVHFEPLFQQFIQEIPKRIPPKELIYSLKNQGYHQILMTEFIKVIK